MGVNIQDLQKTKVKHPLEQGRQDVTFVSVDWDTRNGDVEGLYVRTKELTTIYIKIFETGDNIQLDYLFSLLGCETYDVYEANKAYGTVISVEGYKNNKGYINPNFGPRNLNN